MARRQSTLNFVPRTLDLSQEAQEATVAPIPARETSRAPPGEQCLPAIACLCA